MIAPHGAALTHLPLCPPDARVLELFHPLYGTAAYALLAAAVGIDYAALVGRDWESDAPAWNQPREAHELGSLFLDRHFRVDLEALSGYLATVV